MTIQQQSKMHNSPVFITNKSQAIASTNYFDSEFAASGDFFLSLSSGALRLLMPDNQKSALRDMRSAKYVIVTRGPWQERGGIEAVELLFEDHSEMPYVLTLPYWQCDWMIAGRQGDIFNFSVWTRGGMKIMTTGRNRGKHPLPCLKAWGEY